ncbi:hypothetical protein P22_1641 [Propionispora sp. 2/2-37]|uniref:hypothetical protein n=1 Tax=Propionispora sp. 2/2-37 TaxID=1677858 RepID=UPI0006BB9790|nr:hypothetical protein [Propionispora sp. 2/2-37]CUH95570.1 hypothetical protein P22_1641 [Propionispora sp. 2/2-37]
MSVTISNNQAYLVEKPNLSAEQQQRINRALNDISRPGSRASASDNPAYILDLSDTATSQTTERVQASQNKLNAGTVTDKDNPAYIVELSTAAIELQKQASNPLQDRTKPTSKTLIAQL